MDGSEEVHERLNKMAGRRVTIETPYGHLHNCEVIDCFDDFLRVHMEGWSEVGIPLAQVVTLEEIDNGQLRKRTRRR